MLSAWRERGPYYKWRAKHDDLEVSEAKRLNKLLAEADARQCHAEGYRFEKNLERPLHGERRPLVFLPLTRLVSGGGVLSWERIEPRIAISPEGQTMVMSVNGFAPCHGNASVLPNGVSICC